MSYMVVDEVNATEAICEDMYVVINFLCVSFLNEYFNHFQNEVSLSHRMVMCTLSPCMNPFPNYVDY